MTLSINRMDIDDAGANPRKLAQAISKQLPAGKQFVPVREIALAIDIEEIRETILDGLDGSLIVPENKSYGVIVVHSEMHETRKRFTIAHELGHYVNPTHRSNSHDGFKCSRADMSIDAVKAIDRHTKMELQANQFAAELLMPEVLVDEFLRGKRPPDLEHVRQLPERFYVSKEAAAQCYLGRIEEPAAVVFSHNGIIRYVKTNAKFPKLSIWTTRTVPSGSLSSTSRADVGHVTDVVETPGQLWLERSFGVSLGEQTLAQKGGYRMTMLSIETMEKASDDWEPPSFR